MGLGGVSLRKWHFEQRLWRRGGDRPEELEGRGGSQCKGPGVRVCPGTSVDLEGVQGGCRRVSEGRRVGSKVCRDLRPLEGICLVLGR